MEAEEQFEAYSIARHRENRRKSRNALLLILAALASFIVVMVAVSLAQNMR